MAGAAAPVAVVAHDAGGAEVLSSHVSRRGLDCRFALDGPARAVFERKLGAVQNLTLDAALRGSASLLCGTSWQSDLELEAIELARTLGRPSTAWLDHWVNYRERFARPGGIRLPDALWVSDAAALALARRCVPEVPVCLVENPYFADLAVELARETSRRGAGADGVHLLYVCEPVCDAAMRQFGDPLHWGYTEDAALRYFLDHVDVFGAPLRRIVIRRHPSEAPGKYQDILAAYSLPVVCGEAVPLSEDVAGSDCVIGCASMAMVVGLLGGKRVVCSIPPGGAPCPLPQPEIEMLQDLARFRGRPPTAG